MDANLTARRADLDALCRKHRVARLDVFGSAARGTAGATSDLDFLVEFLPIAAGAYADAYFDLLSDLQSLFGRRVDLLTASSITNPYLRRSVDRDRVLLYAA